MTTPDRHDPTSSAPPDSEMEGGPPAPRAAYAEFHISLERLARWLAITVVFLIVATLIAQFLKWHNSLLAAARFFDSDDKINIPTGFKIIMLFLCAATVWAIARAAAQAGDRWTREWHILAIVVAFLGFDETTLLHQSISKSLDQQFDFGPIHFSWILIYLPGAVLVIALLWKFFRQMARPARRGLATGGLLFVGGAGLVEIFKGLLIDKDPVTGESLEPGAAFNFTAAFSDSLEFIGLSIFLLAGLAELGRRVVAARIIIGDPTDVLIEPADAEPGKVKGIAQVPGGLVLKPLEDHPRDPDWWEPKR